MAEAIALATPEAAGQRAAAILRRLPEPQPGKRVVVAELGVWDGRMSELLLTREDLVLMMVDTWAPTEARPQSYLDSGDARAAASDEDMERARLQAMGRTGFAMHRAQIHRCDTVEAAEKVKDGALDLVFIDADHSLEGVTRDIQAWRSKVKPGGYIGGHDYGDPQFPGVEQAVHLFWDDVETDTNATWFVRI